MSRRLVLFLVLGLVVVLGAAGALVVSGRSTLDDRRSTVDTHWATLRTPLAARYSALEQVARALAAAGAGNRTYTTDLTAELDRWSALAGSSGGDAGAEAATANRLEGLAARTRVNVAASARLARDPGVTQALATFDAALAPPPSVRAYNRAVRRYQAARTDTTKRLAAAVLGYGPRPVLVVGTAPAG